MKEIRRYLITILLLFVFTAAANAGQIDTTVAPPTSAGQIDTTVVPPATPGQIDTTAPANTTGVTDAVESLTELALNICQSVLL
jgi:hypothetical protein